MLSLSNFSILSSWNLILTSNVLCCVISKAAFNSGSDSWALFPSTQAGIFCGLAPWILRKQVHGVVIYKCLSNLLLLLVIRLFQMTDLLMARVMLQIIFHTEEIEVAAESSNVRMMIPTHLPSEETNPTLCCWFCSTSIIPIPGTQAGTGTMLFCRGGSDHPACEKEKSGFAYQNRIKCAVLDPCAVSMESAGFHGKSVAEQQHSGHTHGMAPAGLTIPPSALPSSCSLPSLGYGEIIQEGETDQLCSAN